jgi:hypothetical protein
MNHSFTIPNETKPVNLTFVIPNELPRPHSRGFTPLGPLLLALLVRFALRLRLTNVGEVSQLSA